LIYSIARVILISLPGGGNVPLPTENREERNNAGGKTRRGDMLAVVERKRGKVVLMREKKEKDRFGVIGLRGKD